MSFENYFRDELDYLRQLGHLIAQEKPHLAAFLSEKGADPDVERLLEGVALLTGNLREKLDDYFPELTHGLLAMLWPNYLRPVPSMTIIEYRPKKNILTQATLIKSGVELLSHALEDGVEETWTKNKEDEEAGAPKCIFTQCRDLWLLPVDLEDIRLNNSNKLAILHLEFSANKEIPLHKLGLDKLRFWLGENSYSSCQLYFWFSYYFEKAELVLGEETYPLPDFDFNAQGFERDEAMLPYPKNAAMGYRILQEYFCFPEGFLFFGVKGISRALPEHHAEGFSLRFYFSRPLPPDVKIRRDTLRLHCVPAVNLFSRYSESIMLDGTRAEYPLSSSFQRPDLYDIFSVDKVESWLENTQRGNLRSYTPFESFQHQVEYAKGREKLYYRVRTKASLVRPGLEHSLSFVRGDEEKCVLHNETVAVRLTCTNRDLPGQLGVGDIAMPAEKNPSFTEFQNITRPTAPLYPVLDGSLHWSLISNMSLNYLSLLSKEALRQILQTYDLPAMHDRQAARASQKKLEGITQVETRPVDRLFRGVPLRGLETTLWLDQSAFSSEGELYLFGTILDRFFSLYASVNSFHVLKVINVANKECYEWPVQIGQRALI